MASTSANQNAGFSLDNAATKDLINSSMYVVPKASLHFFLY